MHDDLNDDPDDPDESDQDDSENADMSEHVPCPYCHRKIAEEAELCPHCGSYISKEDASSSRPRWFVVTVVITLIVVVFVWVIKGW